MHSTTEIISGIGNNADALTAVGCLAISCSTAYVTYRLIRIRHPKELPEWASPLLALMFIASAVLSGFVTYQYGLWRSTTLTIP